MAADIFCSHSDIVLRDNAVDEIKWLVVSSRDRVQPQKPWRKKPKRGCSKSWHSVGEFYRPIEVVSGPRLGQLKIKPRSYLTYTSSSLGEDDFVLQLFWRSHFSGEPMSARIRYKVQVVSRISNQK
jgi:hypothetical protein